VRHRSVIGALAAMVLAIAGAPARADDNWTGSILEEDDFWAPNDRDRHYTHGIRFSGTSGDVHTDFWQAPFRWLGSLTPAFPTAPTSRGATI
jgi:hypothetical protein